MLKRLWRSRLAKLVALPLLAVAALAGNTAPAGAWIASSTDWHQGRATYSHFFNNGYVCTSGPHFYSYTNNNYYMAMPRHCFQSNCSTTFDYVNKFASRWEASSADNFDHAQIVLPNNATYPCMDVLMVNLGHINDASARQRASNNIFNYCNPNQLWNCSSWNGGGYAVNPAWAGSWKAATGASTYSNFNGWGSVCKSGQASGTSCGTVNGYFYTTYGPFTSPVNQLAGMGQCGGAGGDSGGVVYHEPTGSWNVATSVNVTTMGMVVAGPADSWNSGSGNSCYGPNTVYSDRLFFIPNGWIMAAFPSLQLSPVIWNP